MNVAINGRFRMQQVTGVQRYAHEIARRLPAAVNVITPSRGGSGLGGHVWEQCSLPHRLAGRALWSPCNTGPLGVRRQAVTIHDTSFFDTPQYFSRGFVAWYQWLIPRLVRRVAHIFTVSEFSKRQLLNYFQLDSRRITVTPNGGSGFQPAAAERVAAVRAGHALRRDYLLYVGSLKPSKNLAALLLAWERSGLAPRGLELAVVGARGSVFSDLGIPRLPAGVRLLGYVGDDELVALYTGALVFVFPTLYEGFGMPALEAMACGAPVVTSQTTSLPEVVGDAAELVDPQCVDSIADGMLRVVESDSLRGEMRVKGLERSRLFTWDRTTAIVAGVLAQISEDG